MSSSRRALATAKSDTIDTAKPRNWFARSQSGTAGATRSKQFSSAQDVIAANRDAWKSWKKSCE